MTPRPNPNAHPTPSSTGTLLASDQQHEVQRTIDEHPEIDTMGDDAERGQIIDITARRINPGGGEKPWGRKARSNDPNNPNCNGDGMTFLRPDGLFEIYDCISGVDGQSSWEGWGPYAPGENGYWWPPNPVEDGGEGGQSGTIEARIVALETQVATLAGQVSDLQGQSQNLDARIATIEAALAQGFHTHGPVDLPIVVESLTRMRAKGDIDVTVKPGHATPPPVSTDDSGPASILVIKRLLDRVRPEDDEASQ